jgi:hypothetical protein
MHSARSLRRAPAASQIAVAAAALLALAATAAQAAPHYRIVDLGVVGAATASQAFGVSPNGSTAVGRDLAGTSNPAYSFTQATGAVALPNLAGRN